MSIRSYRTRNVLLNLFELWVAVSGIISGIVYVIAPGYLDQNSVSLTVGHHLAYIWSASYGIAGLFIAFGLFRPSPRSEIAGLFLLGSATAINGTAIFDIFGMRGFATAVTFLTLTIAAWVRAILVFRRAWQYAVEESNGAGS